MWTEFHEKADTVNDAAVAADLANTFDGIYYQHFWRWAHIRTVHQRVEHIFIVRKYFIV